ncbi:MAG: ABC transporter substrate-binding protein [Candidatus Hodarchaeota archaeon]
MKRLKILAAIMLVLVTLTFLPGCIGQEEEPETTTPETTTPETTTPETTTPLPPLKIGVIGPMQYPQGKHHKYGAEMAVEEINAQGGVLGHQLELVIEDSDEIERPLEAGLPMERLLTQHGDISVIVGGFRTEGVLVMQEVAMEHKTLFLGCGAATPLLCEKVLEDYDTYKYWFRVTPINSTMLFTVMLYGVAMVAGMMKAGLGIETPKVALMIEAAVWADGFVPGAIAYLPMYGMEVIDAMPTTPEIDAWRPSATATDVDAELAAIQDAGAHIIFTALSGPVGITYAKRWGELKIPAASIGINVESQKMGFWAATGGKGEFEATLNTYARTAINELTIDFYDEFEEKFSEWPTYNAGTYEAIHLWANAVERAGTVDPEKVIPELEKTGTIGGKQKFRDADEGLGTNGKYVFTASHDINFGSGFVLALITQWQAEKVECVWPFGEMAGTPWPNYATAAYTLPPWVVEHWTQ